MPGPSARSASRPTVTGKRPAKVDPKVRKVTEARRSLLAGALRLLSADLNELSPVGVDEATRAFDAKAVMLAHAIGDYLKDLKDNDEQPG